MVKGIYFFVGLFCLHVNIIYSQLTYQKTYGGGLNDYAESIQATADGGFIVTGTTWSYGTGGGDPRDMYTVKVNNLGQVVWATASGSTNNRQEGKHVSLSADGGYLLAGRTYDIADANDSWYLQKFDAAGANVFNKVFGKNNTTAGGAVQWDDEMHRVIQHPLLPNILTMIGFTNNYRQANNRDITISQYNTLTNAIEPSRTQHIGSRNFTETGRDLIYENASAAFTVFGTSDSSFAGNGTDFVIAKLAAITNNVTNTNRTIGTTGFDDGWSCIKTADGGYVMVGQTDFTNGGALAGNNMLVIKVTNLLTLSWARLIGGGGDDRGFNVKETSVADGSNLVIIGLTSSFGAGSTDMFVVKLSGTGNLIWSKTYGGSGADEGRWVDIRSDGSFLFAGACSEPVSPAGSFQDFYVVSASSTGYSGGCNEMSVTPTVLNINSSINSVTGLTQGTTPLDIIAQPMTSTSATPTLTCKCTNYIPNKEITGLTQVCKNSSHTYYINKYPNINNYTWSITGGTFATPPGATDTSVNVNFTNTNVQIIVRANIAPASCTFALDTIDITVDNITTVITTADSMLCVGESTTLNAITTLNQGTVSYVWNPPLPTPSASEVVTPGTTTTYTVTATDSWVCSATDTIRVTVFPYPVVNLGPNDTICNVSPVVLNAGNPGATYLWSNSTTASTLNVTTSGTYWVDVTRNGCTTRDSIILGISNSPSITMTGDDSICIGQNTVITAVPTGGSGPYQYLWAGGLGTANNINVSPATNTTYTVTVTEAYGCTNTATQLVNVFAYPVVDIGPDSLYCDVASVLLNATTASSTYLWSTSATTATINALTTGIYWVDVDRFGCVTRDSIDLRIGVTPVVTVTGDDSLCINQASLLVASATGGTTPYAWLWSSGLGTNDSVNVAPATTTTYTVQATEVNGCTGTTSFTVNVFAYPTVDLGPDVGICDGASPFVTLDAQNPGGAYNWSTTANTQTIDVAVSGTYWVDVTVNGCTSRDTSIVTFSTTPVASATGDMDICTGTSTWITASATGGTLPYTFTWLPGPIQADSINLSPLSTANYSLITSDFAGCADTVLFTIIVRAYPVVDLGMDTTGCTGQPVVLNAPATTGTTQWSTGSGAGNISVNTPGVYWVDITENNCTTRDSIVVSFNPLPVVDLGPDTVVCSVQNLVLDATNVAATYAWSTSANTPTITINQTGLYWVNVTACGTTVSDSVFLTVDTFSVYVVQLTPNECGQTNGSLTIGSTAAAPTTYQWTSGATGTNPALTSIGDGIFIVNVTSGNGCTNTSSFTVTCVQPQLIVTQLVTPNSDGKNDTWIIQGINNYPDAIVKLFNRWGNEIYYAAPYNNDWDGKSNSSMSLGTGYLPAGTYFYTVDMYGDGSSVKSGYIEFQP